METLGIVRQSMDIQGLMTVHRVSMETMKVLHVAQMEIMEANKDEAVLELGGKDDPKTATITALEIKKIMMVQKVSIEITKVIHAALM